MHVQWTTFVGPEACLLAVQLRNADHTRYRGYNFGANNLNVRHSTKVFLLLELLSHCCPCSYIVVLVGFSLTLEQLLVELICNVDMDIRKSVSYINKFYPNGSQQLGDKCCNTLKYDVTH